MLAYTVSFDPSDDYLTITKAAGDTAAIAVSESGGNLNITDTGGTAFQPPDTSPRLSVGMAAGAIGVTVTSSGVKINQTVNNVAHIVFDLTSGAASSSNTVAFAALPNPIPGFDVLGVAGSSDTVSFAGNVTTSSTASEAAGNATTASINLSKVAYVEINAASVTIATAANDDDDPGNVSLGGYSEDTHIETNTSGANLTIDTGLPSLVAMPGVFALGSEPETAGSISLGSVGPVGAGPDINNLVLTGVYSGDGSITLGGNITTTGTQTYDGQLYLPVGVSLTSTGPAASSDITFGGTIQGGAFLAADGDTETVSQGGAALSVDTAGKIAFDGAVSKVSQLSVEGGSILLGTGISASISTLGRQEYSGPVTLDGATTLTSTGSTAYQEAAGITFGSAVDGAFNLIAESDGPIDFAGAVGASVPLASITTEGDSSAATGLVEIGAAVATTGMQTYNQPVELESTGSISEGVEFATDAYELQVQAEQASGAGAPQSLQFSVDGASAGSPTPAASGYPIYSSAPFAVTAGIHTVNIASSPAGSGSSLLLKNISFHSVNDFAVSSVAEGTWQYDPVGTPWTFTGTAGVSGNESGITAGNSPAPQGSQVAFVQDTGSISQVVSMSAGTYTLDFLAAQRENYNFGGQSLQVLVDGSPVGSAITPSGSGYGPYASAAFTVTAGMHTITIEGLDPNEQDNTALVDALRLQPVTTNQVADPDFSQAGVSLGNWQYAPIDSVWYFFGTAGVSGNDSGITAGNPLAPQGSQVAFVQDTGSISQAVGLAGGTYTISFMAAQREDYNHGGESLEVLVDGSPIGTSITPSGSGYLSYSSAAFAVPAGIYTIEILGLDPTGGDNTALIDSVSLVPATPSRVIDPDFSLVSVGTGTWQYAPVGSVWTFTGTAGVSGNYSGITDGNAPAPQGGQVGFVQETGSMSQIVDMSAGTYTLDFLAAQREDYNFGGQSLQVLVDGSPVGSSITPACSSYALYASASFTVAAGAHTITIEGLDPDGQDNTALVDEISLQPVPANQALAVADPDFAGANVGLGTFQYAPADSSWYFLGTAGVSGNFSSITAYNDALPGATDVGFVQETGSISVAVSLTAGTYTLSFMAAQRGIDNTSGQSLQLSIDGAPVGPSITPSGTAYALYQTATFTVRAGTHVISVTGLDPQGGDNTALIDYVYVVTS